MKRIVSIVLLCGLLFSALAHAQISADVQTRLDEAKRTLAELGKVPAVIAAVKDSNGKAGLVPGMSNAKWDELAENAAPVQSLSSNAASKALQEFSAKHSELNKLYLRDEKGNLVAAGSGGKTLLWNVSSRPFFKPVMEGKSWSDNAVKPDPTTQVKGILFVVPVMEGDKAIGLLQSNLTVK